MEDKKVILETVDGERIELNVQKEKFPKRVWNGLKTGVTNVVEKTKDFVIEHPLTATIIVSSTVRLTKAVADAYCKCQNAKNNRLDAEWGEKKLYDRKNDVYYTLNRPMTNRENMEYSVRKANGEPVYDILSDMNLI